jgi:NNP family nitrate/nitrite transporter-like MFS transporter
MLVGCIWSIERVGCSDRFHLFGWMNLFARGLGGAFSDGLQESMGMRGRLIAQTMLLLFEGIAVVVFARTDTLAGAVIVLVLFSLFVQAAEGASYGNDPYVDPPTLTQSIWDR